ncbi:MAG: MBL fold metallo-hydrolase [Oceanococcus sp.]
MLYVKSGETRVSWQSRSMLGWPGAFISSVLLLSACATPPPVTEDAVKSLHTDNRHEGRFFNPWKPFTVNYGAALRQVFIRNRYKGQDFGEVPRQVDAKEQFEQASSDSVTWIGHATMMIREGSDIVLTDPHFSDWALLAKRKTAPGLNIEDIPSPRFVVISHNHYDHLDEETVLALPADTVWLVPMGLAQWFRDLGREHVIELNWWQSTELNGWTAHCVPVQHWSRRLGQATNSTLWCGWVLQSPAGRRYFFAGDTGYFHGFKEIARRFGRIDVAMLPIGAHYPESFLEYQHMNPAQALQAFEDLQAKTMLPMHWGSFKLTLEPLAEPAVTLRRLLENSSVTSESVKPLALGETWLLPALK